MSGTALGKDKLSKDPQFPFTQDNLHTACEHMIHESSSSDSKEKISFFFCPKALWLPRSTQDWNFDFKKSVICFL